MKVPISTVGLVTIITNLMGEKWYFLLCSLMTYFRLSPFPRVCWPSDYPSVTCPVHPFCFVFFFCRRGTAAPLSPSPHPHLILQVSACMVFPREVSSGPKVWVFNSLYYKLLQNLVLLLIVSTTGLPWLSSGNDLVLPLQGVRVQSLVGELRSHAAKGKKKKLAQL